MKVLHYVAFLLVIVGAINWLLVAFEYNLVTMLVGAWPMVEKVVYILVGISAVVLLITHKKDCKVCSVGTAPMA